MKNRVLILLTIMICGTSILQAQRLNVATYNIRNENAEDVAKGNGWKQRCPVIAQLIRFHDFDIFGSQEVLNGQLKDLLAAMPEYAYIGVGRDDGMEKGEYAPVFYKKGKFTLIDSGHFWLSETTDKPNKGWDAVLPRICTWGEFQMNRGGNRFWFFNLHMDHVGVEARLQSAKLVLNRIRTMCGNQPVILSGDFNVDQFNEAYKLINTSDILKDTYNLANVKYALNGTFNSFDPNLNTDNRIDHIFVSSGFNVLRYGVLTDSYRSKIENITKINSDNAPQKVSSQQYIARLPSDHFPVMTELAFSK